MLPWQHRELEMTTYDLHYQQREQVYAEYGWRTATNP